MPGTIHTLSCNGEDARIQLSRKVKELLSASESTSLHTIVRTSVEIGAVNLFQWLRAQHVEGCIYWGERDQESSVAGLGEADVAFANCPGALKELAEHLGPKFSNQNQDIRYYGGLRFDRSRALEKTWDRFGAWRFVLPRFEVRTHARGATLYCNLLPFRDRFNTHQILGSIEALNVHGSVPVGNLPHPETRLNRPTRSEWNAMVNWALNEFKGEELDKVVLARVATFAFSEDLDPLDLLEHLASETPRCFHFLFQPSDATAFVGASPERLFRRCGRSMESEAVAGTRPLGGSEAEDAHLLMELLQSEKELREHEYVRISLQEQLGLLASDFFIDPQPSEMKLANGRHLVSRIRATLRKGVTSLDLLEGLHPTPAVGGYPSTSAVRAICRKEPFDRGWYAGPVGWIGPDQAEFAVAIRSGLIHKQLLSLYSGSGIVEGSKPQSEWEEIEHKITGFTKVLRMETTKQSLVSS